MDHALGTNGREAADKAWTKPGKRMRQEADNAKSRPMGPAFLVINVVPGALEEWEVNAVSGRMRCMSRIFPKEVNAV